MATETVAIYYEAAKTVRLEVIRTSDGKRLDWDDDTFKSAGWGTREKTITEDATTPGRYPVEIEKENFTDDSYEFVVKDATVTAPLASFSVGYLYKGSFMLSSVIRLS